MDTATKNILLPTLASLPLTLAWLSVTASTLVGRHLPLLGTDRAAFIAVLGLGLATCAAAGPWVSFSQLGAGHWSTVAGIGLGVAALAVVVSAFTGHWLPGVGTWRAATLVLSAVMASKLILAFLRVAG